MSGIEINNLSITFGKKRFFHRMSFVIEKGDVGVLLGLSGSGKSTILKCILGVQLVDQGSIFLNGKNVTKVPLRERDIGYVPQEQHLFPNMTTAENLEFGLRMRGISREIRKKRIKEIADLLGIDFLTKDPRLLSGGEKQRVALGRAIAPNPSILLMDEPLSSLDTAERLNMSLLLKEVLGELDVTTLYVTHSPQEAEILADKVIMLENGKILQEGRYRNIVNAPASMNVAKILGIHNVFSTSEIAGINIENYRKGEIYIVPPKVIKKAGKGIEATVIAHSGKFTYVRVGKHVLTMEKINLEGKFLIDI